MILKEYKSKKIKNPKDVAKILQAILCSEHKIDQDKEHLWCIGLNTRNIIKYIELVSLGTLDETLIEPREVFRLAIFKGVKNIIVAHNHPSGNLRFSNADIQATERLKKCGEILGIGVLDHILITVDDYISMKQEGLM
ncbi:DNA repair protein RadC [Deferribacter autotrophicus]|uniref:DNA repair protein RadC n=1 Tax=Deferribacter autotrophicus TaxID=500465 RepID=A0A5A8F6Z8_9BACT|nr:JAB domain-containing protein [Deferribacter autotrophicus]KAA0257547.1 DNA repair protein RadC [Deferribacter autotrophicus]